MDNDSYLRSDSTGSANFYDNDHDTGTGSGTAVLNTLITTLIDSIDGYQKAAADTSNERFAEMFNARARDRQQHVTKLQAVVARLGGDPSDDGSTTAAMHRGWINLKEAVMGRDDEAIVTEVDRGETYLRTKFEAALRNTDLPPEARTALEEAWTSVQAGQQEANALRQAIT